MLTVVGQGADLAAARVAAEAAADRVTWDGMQRRHDIAADVPLSGDWPLPATLEAAR